MDAEEGTGPGSDVGGFPMDDDARRIGIGGLDDAGAGMIANTRQQSAALVNAGRALGRLLR